MSDSLSALCYLIASVCFIMALRGLSSPETARAGNIYGIAGMVIAVVTTLVTPHVVSFWLIIVGILIGGAIGTYIAMRIQMTALPQLVAAFHSARSQGGILKLANLGQKFNEVLQMTKLMTVFDTYSNEGAAIQSFRS